MARGGWWGGGPVPDVVRASQWKRFQGSGRSETYSRSSVTPRRAPAGPINVIYVLVFPQYVANMLPAERSWCGGAGGHTAGSETERAGTCVCELTHTLGDRPEHEFAHQENSGRQDLGYGKMWEYCLWE